MVSVSTLEQGHGAASSERSGADVIGGVAICCFLQESGDVGCLNLLVLISWGEVCGKNGGGCNVVLSKVDDSPDCSSNRAQKVVATQAMVNNFTPHSVLLRCKSIGDAGSAPQVVLRGGEQVETAVANQKLDVLESEWGDWWAIVWPTDRTAS